MRTLFVILTAVTLVACATTENGTPELWEVPLNDEEVRHIAGVEEDGRLLYRKDQYAARATRLLLDAVDIADYPHFVGWVGYEGEHTYIVSFYERNEDEVTLVADVHFGEDSSLVESAPDRSISAREISMLNARMAALDEGTSSCSDRFNTVVMSSQEDDAAWMVYVLAATTNPNAIVVGGHSRVRVAKATTEILEVERLSNSCLTLDKSKMEGLGSEEGIVVLTHHVTPMPLPIHPFLSLLHERRFFVVSERGRWSITGHKISLF